MERLHNSVTFIKKKIYLQFGFKTVSKRLFVSLCLIKLIVVKMLKLVIFARLWWVLEVKTNTQNLFIVFFYLRTNKNT